VNPEELRETVVRAAMSLSAEWDEVTTAQIADAAGIDEAALLTMFNDKDAVLLACTDTIKAIMESALDPTQLVRELGSIPLEQPLAARLVEAVGSLDTYHGRMITALAPLSIPDTPARRRPAPDGGTAREPRTRRFKPEDLRGATRIDVICHAVTELLEPDQEHLRLPAVTLADAFLALYSACQQTPPAELSSVPPERLHWPPLPAEQLVELFLHGALTTTGPA
jgi:AcrR family transcriptional regulator